MVPLGLKQYITCTHRHVFNLHLIDDKCQSECNIMLIFHKCKDASIGSNSKWGGEGGINQTLTSGLF